MGNDVSPAAAAAAASTNPKHRVCNTVFLPPLLIANIAREKIIDICVLQIIIRIGHNS